MTMIAANFISEQTQTTHEQIKKMKKSDLRKSMHMDYSGTSSVSPHHEASSK